MDTGEQQKNKLSHFYQSNKRNQFSKTLKGNNFSFWSPEGFGSMSWENLNNHHSGFWLVGWLHFMKWIGICLTSAILQWIRQGQTCSTTATWSILKSPSATIKPAKWPHRHCTFLGPAQAWFQLSKTDEWSSWVQTHDDLSSEGIAGRHILCQSATNSESNSGKEKIC